MTNAASEATLDFYGSLLDVSDTRLEQLCRPEVLISDEGDDVRIQDFKSDQLLRNRNVYNRVNSKLRTMAAHVLTRTLETNEPGTASMGITDGVELSSIPKLLLHPKLITGSIKNLQIRPVAESELDDASVMPRPLVPNKRTPVSSMDTYFMLAGEVQVSRSIGYVACGIRLSEFVTPMNHRLKYSTGRTLDETGTLVDQQWTPETSPEYVYTFGVNGRRAADTASGPLGALLESIHNARAIEGSQMQNPFGRMSQ